jgi:hypothetical protein
MTALKFDVLGDLQSFSPSCAVEVPLAAAIDQTELRFIIEVENVSLGNVGMAMFGPPPLETAGLLDLLLEIGNTAAGTFVRRALEDDSELTMGLPAALSVEDVSRRVETMTAVRDVGICTTDGGTRLRVRVGIRGKKNVLVPVSKLREGMVLASDVKSTSGVLLARAGTRMTSNQAERITAMLGNTTVVEVSDAAA